MDSSFSTKLASRHLVIFDLPAVVSYDHLPLRRCLIDALVEHLQHKPELTDIDWTLNCKGVVNQIYRANTGNAPDDPSMERVRSTFALKVKEYFLQNEDPFEVWPGVQNIFGSLAKREAWNFLIISDYWLETTRFILDSCGIFSRNIKLLTADDGERASDILLQYSHTREQQGEMINYVLARELQVDKLPRASSRWKRIQPPGISRANLLEYPRFSKLFAESAP